MLAFEGADIEHRGAIYNRSIQILAYANDTEITERTERAVKEAFENLERTVREMGLWVNKGKTKCIEVTFDRNQI
jgi:hypothetical protein